VSDKKSNKGFDLVMEGDAYGASDIERDLSGPKGPWGDWSYDSENNVFTCTARGSEYHILLDQFYTPQGFISWLAQISEKSWGGANCLGDMVKAVDDVIGLRVIAAN